MININLIFPAIGFKERDKNIYVFRKDIGIVSKGGDKFYKDLTLIDSAGYIYQLENAHIGRKAKFHYWLKYFQPMIEMDLSFKKIGNLTLDELKNKIMIHIEQDPKKWLALDTLEGLRERVARTNDFNELITLFR